MDNLFPAQGDKRKWIDIQEFLAVVEWNKLQTRVINARMWHDNYLKVQEMGLDAYLKQFED